MWGIILELKVTNELSCEVITKLTSFLRQISQYGAIQSSLVYLDLYLHPYRRVL